MSDKKTTPQIENVFTSIFMADTTNNNIKVYESNTEMPDQIRGILAAFVQRINQVCKFKPGAVSVLSAFSDERMRSWNNHFNKLTDVEVHPVENDYEDLEADSVACPICGKQIEGPFNYASILYSQSKKENRFFVISTTVLIHYLTRHNFTVPERFGAFVMGKYFDSFSIVKPHSEMTKEELIDELKRVLTALNEVKRERDDYAALIDSATSGDSDTSGDSNDGDDDDDNDDDDGITIDAESGEATDDDEEEEEEEDDSDGNV